MKTIPSFDWSTLGQPPRRGQARRPEPPEVTAARAQYAITLAALEQARAAYREARERHGQSKRHLHTCVRAFLG